MTANPELNFVHTRKLHLRVKLTLLSEDALMTIKITLVCVKINCERVKITL
jgi:hypothetical protein